MRAVLSYRDAVVLLGGESALTQVLDKASSVALFGLGGIDLFDARAEAVRLGDDLIRRLRDKTKGLSRYDRTQRLAAAHAVIVMSAYLEVLGESGVLPELTKDDQNRLLGLADAGDGLIGAALPMPAPHLAYEDVLGNLSSHYVLVTDSLVRLLEGLACWDAWDETRRDRLARELPGRAVRRYEELFLRLATDFPEVACWSAMVGQQATRAQVARGLAGLQEQLSRIASGRGPSERLAALIQANRATLHRPIVTSADTPPGMTIPRLGDGYVNPGFRVFPPGDDRRIISEEFWEHLPQRDDLDAFLAAHLTLPAATRAPLLVLGQPGAGKSVMTRMLAARLPPSEFLPLRVELRGVPADSDVLAQIEHGIKDALDESMSWPELVHAAGGALPVVMLDGFDELLQATGVSQTDYLERVADFQQRQAERGRAVIVIVTSRTAVADRARVPAESNVLRMEPFAEHQVRQWISVWNTGNRPYFQRHGLEPLQERHVLAVPRLAEQPLLLLMLALYDADGNALRLTRDELHEADLYERLLRGFAAREVRKTNRGLAAADLERAVEDELLRLSVTAFAMFNRGHQWVREADLDADLRALLPAASETPQPQGFRRVLSRAETVIGGFFFVHATEALREEERLKTYEFLHATFSEYLVARLVLRELSDLADELAFAASRHRPARPDESFLYALLSFAALVVRERVVDFLRYGMRHQIPADGLSLLRQHLHELFATSLMPRPGSVYDGYQPAHADAPTRCAAYSANLLLLSVLAADGPIPGAELFCGTGPEANESWRKIARLWHAQLTRAEWAALTNTVRVRHFLNGRKRMMEVGEETGESFHLRDLAFYSWPRDVGATPPRDFEIASGGPLDIWAREISFRDDPLLAQLFVNLIPYARHVEPVLDAGAVSPVADFLELLLAPSQERKAQDQAGAGAVSDLQRAPVPPGDVARDGQPEPAPPGVP
ncbi:hypothetical protein SAMN05444920_102493 [Nonomuraea solani]|uniref:NACHT N-terminal Helical domain-containing protein n=1 Tax=Nonomuraea solani TaxID=1144553 RepID=A0A1H5YZS6_9ACTN|nr:hypothetical protein SAMN05444920_102493 [Nonomuraea solani]